MKNYLTLFSTCVERERERERESLTKQWKEEITI